MKYLIIILAWICSPIILSAQNHKEYSKFEFSIESGLHMDVIELIEPSYGSHNPRPSFIPEDFQPEKVLKGWSNRVKIKYNFNKKWSVSGRLGYTTFKRTYSKSNSDIYGIFGDKKYIERYFPMDFLLERKVNFKNSTSYLNIAAGPIIRFFDDSSMDYGIAQNRDGEYYVPGFYASSRNFGDIGFSFNLAYAKEINNALDIGINLNAYTLFGGYGLESIILAPFGTLKF
ncbi:hypothetical protein ABWH96_19360 [Marivirga tractuosa]|uniref:hypothetical protein n=1 Tax=Marivirga tractuosa TaxID=1006 RepID=UPI0035CF7588